MPDVDRRRARVQYPVDTEIVGDAMRDTRTIPLAGQELLRQRRPLIRHVRLVADERCTDDDDGAHARNWNQPSIVIACVGHNRAASSTSARRLSGGSSCNT